MRRAFAVSALILAASCGGGPMTPSTNGPQQPALSISSGAYLLTILMATNGTGISTCTSLTSGGETPTLSGVFVPVPVQVDHSGNSVSIAPDDPAATFRMQLQLTGPTLSGTASGKFQSSATTVNVTGTTNGAAAATGIVGLSNVVGGLTGTVSIPGLSCTNNGHSWTLAPR